MSESALRVPDGKEPKRFGAALRNARPEGSERPTLWAWKSIFGRSVLCFLRADRTTWTKERQRLAPTLSPAKTMFEAETGSRNESFGGIEKG